MYAAFRKYVGSLLAVLLLLLLVVVVVVVVVVVAAIHPDNMIVYPRDRSFQIVVHAVTLRQKLQIKFAI